eukprot:CAMPEP_0176094516 /NCGR_PEP_ID=MMETSP0120_2-20121206/47362_1 /TAXON_ID=160619 /ORGANISM="Kryptoperidinium foliaceum, Strain CCMP 1326" /LENGTH=281 /DNA_ID=CAMNT_0017428457 /DNA_START=23 /DNA_END=868 /DNA_ORIENTATION=+
MTGAACGAQWEEKMKGLNAWLADCDTLQRAASRCGVHPSVVAIGGIIWFLGFALWGYTGEFVCTLAGSLYPMYASFRALEDHDYDGVMQWLTYWVTIVALMLAEGVLYRLFCWVPFYHVLRLLFIVLLLMPITCGTATCYRWLVAPVLRRHRGTVDGIIERFSEELRGICGGTCDETCRWAFRSASWLVCSSGPVRRRDSKTPPVSKGLGIQELLAQELASEAAQRLGQAMGTPAAGAPPSAHKPGGFGARQRAASPRPKFVSATPPPCIDATAPFDTLIE